MPVFLNIMWIPEIKITNVRIVAKNEIYRVYPVLDYYYHVHKNLTITL